MKRIIAATGMILATAGISLAMQATQERDGFERRTAPAPESYAVIYVDDAKAAMRGKSACGPCNVLIRDLVKNYKLNTLDGFSNDRKTKAIESGVVRLMVGPASANPYFRVVSDPLFKKSKVHPTIEFYIGGELTKRIESYNTKTRPHLDIVKWHGKFWTNHQLAAWKRQRVELTPVSLKTEREPVEVAQCNGVQFAPYGYNPYSVPFSGCNGGGFDPGPGGGNLGTFSYSPYYAPIRYSAPVPTQVYYAPRTTSYSYRRGLFGSSYQVRSNGGGRMICGPNGCYWQP